MKCIAIILLSLSCLQVVAQYAKLPSYRSTLLQADILQCSKTSRYEETDPTIVRRTFDDLEAVAVKDTSGSWKGFVICRKTGDTTSIFNAFNSFVDAKPVIDIAVSDSLFAALCVSSIGSIEYILWKYNDDTIKALNSSTVFYRGHPSILTEAYLPHPRIVNIRYYNYMTSPRPHPRNPPLKDCFVYFEIDPQKPVTIFGLETPIVVEGESLFKELRSIMHK